jgi:hypothetical protein
MPNIHTIYQMTTIYTKMALKRYQTSSIARASKIYPNLDFLKICHPATLARSVAAWLPNPVNPLMAKGFTEQNKLISGPCNDLLLFNVLRTWATAVDGCRVARIGRIFADLAIYYFKKYFGNLPM